MATAAQYARDGPGTAAKREALLAYLRVSQHTLKEASKTEYAANHYDELAAVAPDPDLQSTAHVFQKALNAPGTTDRVVEALTLLTVIVGALSLIAVDGAKNVPQGMWRAWTYMADPGTHSEARGTGFQFVSIGIALAGILLMAAILGFVVEAIQAKMDELKLGISRVVESDHSLILGWTHETVLVIEEICIANESEGGGTIVVMADRAKPSMEQELSMQLGGPLAMRQRLRGTKVVLRSGSPVLVQDLAKVSAEKARATLILAAPGDPDVADAHTLRCVLAMQSLNYISGHIVAEMRDLDNEPLVRLVGGDVIETVTSHDVLGRLILMSAREPGLASVYSTVLGFDGDEFYAQAWPAIDGLSYGEVAFRFPNAIPIGVRTPTDELVLNPDCARVFAPGDELIVLAEDNDTYKPCPPVVIPTQPFEKHDPPPVAKEKILCCGWRRDIRDILKQLDKQVAPGSELHMMSDTIPINERNAFLRAAGLDVRRELTNLRIVHFDGNTAMRRSLEALPIAEYDSCMIFADQAMETEMMHSDSHVIATLLQLREVQRELMQRAQGLDPEETRSSNIKKMAVIRQKLQETSPIICEVLDPRTQNTIEKNAAVAATSDFCQSNKLIAQILAMCEEDRSIEAILSQLLGPGGASFSVQSALRYCAKGESLTFFELQRRAQVYEETLCGYQDATETVINPRDKNAKQTWHGRDLVVLAGRTTTQPKRFEGRSTLNKSGAGKRRSTNKGRRSLISGRPSRVATVYATAGPLAAPTKTLPE
ncbi:monovalent cation:H+ antiporter [Aureococcus anophagefferens]|uniref:Monovalent cation:H+ antiporter n=1 Tax=Aureococcus anophagefferens TaxID=44056 RepID=A0ABR1G5J7_AURAN